MPFAMKRKPSLLIVLAFWLAAATGVYPQPARQGLSLIAVSAESEAQALRTRIRSGASFEAVAIRYSTDATAPRYGYLGMVEESSLNREFLAALKGLTPG